MSSRRMSLLPWATLHSDSEQYGLKFGEKCSPPKKTVIKNSSKNGYNNFFSPLKTFFAVFSSCFFCPNSLKLKTKKEEKSRKNVLHSKNSGETLIGHTFRVGYTYRADCTSKTSNHRRIYTTARIPHYIPKLTKNSAPQT
jgi:hypothetical protein